MRLKSAIEKLKYDTRMVGLNIQNGTVKASDYDSHKKSLNDLSDRLEKVDLEEGLSAMDSVEPNSGDSSIF